MSRGINMILNPTIYTTRHWLCYTPALPPPCNFSAAFRDVCFNAV